MHIHTYSISGVARNQQKGGMELEGATFSHEKGTLDVYRSACGAIYVHICPARERGAHLRHLGASLMPMTYWGVHVQKRDAL